MELRDKLITAMEDLAEERVLEHVFAMVEQGYSYNEILSCLNTGISRVGQCYERGEYFIADLIVSGMIYRDALVHLSPISGSRNSMPVGRVVIGVAEGDIHDIGKDIIVSLLRAERFEVIDLGVDVKAERFAYALRTYKPDVLLMSGVLSLAVESIRKTIALLKKEGLLCDTPVLVGGLCTNWVEKDLEGVDGWVYDSMDTTKFCKQVIGKKYGTEKNQ